MAALKLKLIVPGRYDVVRLWDGKEEQVGRIQRFGDVRDRLGPHWSWVLLPDVDYFGMNLGQKPHGTHWTLRGAFDTMKGLVI